jgi:hypothetical protein
VAEELICEHSTKVRYPSKSRAQREAKRKKRLGRPPTVMEPYRCLACGDWHLTNRSQSTARKLNMASAMS